MDFPTGNKGLLAYKHQAVFHPVRYVEGLAKAATEKGAKIYCNTKAIKLEDGKVKTVQFENDIIVQAKHVVLATQYPFYDGPNLFFTRLYPKRAYGIAVRAKETGLTGAISMSGIRRGQSERMWRAVSASSSLWVKTTIPGGAMKTWPFIMSTLLSSLIRSLG